MLPWLRAVIDGVWLGLAPFRFIGSWPGWAATVLLNALVIAVLCSLIALAASGARLTVGEWEYPFSQEGSAILALGLLALLLAISTSRLQKRQSDIGDPLRERVAIFIRLGSEFFPLIRSAKSRTDIGSVKSGIHGWNSRVYDTLSRRRMDWALRFTSAYATPEHFGRAPDDLLMPEAPAAWANLQAQLDVLEELFREGSRRGKPSKR